MFYLGSVSYFSAHHRQPLELIRLQFVKTSLPKLGLNSEVKLK